MFKANIFNCGAELAHTRKEAIIIQVYFLLPLHQIENLHTFTFG